MTIKELRLSYGMSQEDMSGRLRIPINSIRNWEQGIRRTPPYLLGVIALFLQYNLKHAELEPTGEAVRKLRLECGLSQSEFSRLTKVPLGTLTRWEYDVSNPAAYYVSMLVPVMEHGCIRDEATITKLLEGSSNKN